MEERAAKGNNKNIKPLSPQEKEEIRLNIFEHLQLPATSGSIRFFPGGKKNWVPQTVAAAVLLAIALPAYFWFRQPVKSSKAAIVYSSLQEIRTGSGEMKRIILQDSTVVLLNAGSALRFRGNFEEGQTREVELEGNAFFSVKKDRLHAAFVVKARSLSVTVLGTELNVNARSEAAEVELASGKVKVERKGDRENATFLLPGEKLRLDTASGEMLKTKMSPQLYYAWTKGEWNFRKNTLEEIMGLLREYYGVEVIFKKKNSKSMRIDAVLPVTSLQNIITVIRHTLQINVEVNNNQLIVQ
jgi:transmembrane sensor